MSFDEYEFAQILCNEKCILISVPIKDLEKLDLWRDEGDRDEKN